MIHRAGLSFTLIALLALASMPVFAAPVDEATDEATEESESALDRAERGLRGIGESVTGAVQDLSDRAEERTARRRGEADEATAATTASAEVSAEAVARTASAEASAEAVARTASAEVSTEASAEASAEATEQSEDRLDRAERRLRGLGQGLSERFRGTPDED